MRRLLRFFPWMATNAFNGWWFSVAWMDRVARYRLKQATQKEGNCFSCLELFFLLELPVELRNTLWTPAEELTKRSCEGLPAHCAQFDLSANLACPCGHCVWLQDRDRHRPSWTIMCSANHSLKKKKLHFPFVCRKMMKYIWGKRICGEKQPL